MDHAPAIGNQWWNNKKYRNYAIFAISVIFSSFVFIQNWFLTNENKALRQDFGGQMERVNHRLDVKDAYRNKGLIDGAKRREEAYIQTKNRLNQVREWCSQHRCGLPPELAAEEVALNFEPIESVLMKEHQEQ